MIGLDEIADFEEVLRIDPELGDLLARLDFSLRKVAAVGLGQAFGLGKT